MLLLIIFIIVKLFIVMRCIFNNLVLECCNVLESNFWIIWNKWFLMFFCKLIFLICYFILIGNLVVNFFNNCLILVFNDLFLSCVGCRWSKSVCIFDWDLFMIDLIIFSCFCIVGVVFFLFCLFKVDKSIIVVKSCWFIELCNFLVIWCFFFDKIVFFVWLVDLVWLFVSFCVKIVCVFILLCKWLICLYICCIFKKFLFFLFVIFFFKLFCLSSWIEKLIDLNFCLIKYLSKLFIIKLIEMVVSGMKIIKGM